MHRINMHTCYARDMQVTSPISVFILSVCIVIRCCYYNLQSRANHLQSAGCVTRSGCIVLPEP